MPFFQIFIDVEKKVGPNENKYVKYINDDDRYLEIKERVEGFNLVFDLTVDCNDDGELGVVFNIHADPSKIGDPLTELFDTSEYNISSEKINLDVTIKIVMMDKNGVPFTNDISENILGFCQIIEDYAKKIKLVKKANGIIYENELDNKYFETKLLIVLNKYSGSCTDPI